MPLKISLIHPYTYTKFNQWLFLKKSENFLREIIATFWDCSSQQNWLFYSIVNREIKKFNLSTVFPCKSFWDYSWKEECNNIISQWKMMFQALDYKWRSFLNLLHDDLNVIEPLYSKGKSWLKYFGHSNSLYARATRAIINHTSISKYCLRFFPQENFVCLCSLYSIESRM